ncbi:MAG: S49 family peptidase, partial [Planctomycetota bacterium]
SSPPRRRRMTYEEFLDWADEDTLAEWVNGEVVMASPPSRQHQEIVVFLTQILGLYATKRELGIVRKQAQAVYDLFLDRVRTGRGKRIAQLDDVAQGRLFTASQAKTVGLIDEVGGLREALAAAKKAARLGPCDVIVMPRPKTIMDLLTSDGDDAELRSPFSLSLGERLIGRLGAAGEGAGYLLTLIDLLAGERVLAAVPWHMSLRP